MKSKTKINHEDTKARRACNALRAIKFFFVFLCLGGIIFFVSSSYSMPLNPDAYKKLKGTAKLGVIQNVFASSPTLNKPSAQKFATVTGTRKVLVLLVDFSDNEGTTASSSFDEKLFSVGTTATGSMRDYYKEVSYGTFDISGTVTTKWYRAPQVYNYYVNYQGGINQGTYPNNAQKLAEDVVNLANTDIDFSQYDSNGDGYVDGLFIVHAGGGAEADGNMGKIWSHKWTTSAVVNVDGVKVLDYTMEPEDGNIGVFCHEYGHELGLPDLYDATPAPVADSYGLGHWSLMAIGGWLNDGKTPSHMDAWSKIQLGWVTPTVPTVNQLSASIPQSETNATVYKLWTNGAPMKEYFLVENRQQTKFDAYLPGGGLLIYHVDDNVTTFNDNNAHYLVALEQADGLKHLEGYANKGDTGDPFPGSTLNKNFSGTTTPNSKDYAGNETYVAVNSISASGATMTADMFINSADINAPTCAVTSLSAYTNSASFLVSWSGSDTGNPASGVKSYDVQYRVGESGTWTDWFMATSAAQAVYTGSDGQVIYFQCRAIDNSNNQGTYGASASTTVDLTAPTASITPLSATQVTAAFTVSWSGSDNLSGVKSYDVEYMDAAVGTWINSWVQAGTTLTTATFAGMDGHTYYFRIRATDNAGNTGSFTSAPNGDAQTIVAVDSVAPVISNVQVTNITADSATIAWTTDEDADSQVEYYTLPAWYHEPNPIVNTIKDSTLAKNHSIALTLLNNAWYYEFKVKSSDSAGNAASSISGFSTYSQFTITIPKGLSMISFGITPKDKNAGNIFGDANLKFASYDASVSPPKYHYYKDDPNDAYLEIKPGRGYWVKLDAEKTLKLIGTGVDGAYAVPFYSVNLYPGWNQVGSPISVNISTLQVVYQNETLSFADASKKGWVANYFWSYENETTGYKVIMTGLSSAKTLDFGKGYWLYSAVPCTLLLFERLVGVKAKESVSSENLSNLIQFTLFSSSGSDTENYAGFANDNMKISDPPPALESTGKPELYLKSASTGETNYALMAKKKNYGEETFYLSASGNDGEQATLSWNFSASEFSSAVLVDVSSNKEISLLSEKQYAFTLSKEPKQFLLKLELNKNSVIFDPVLLNSLKVLSVTPYPTPSKGKLSFNLEAEGSVNSITLEVYTITGKRVLLQFLPVAASSAAKGKGKYKAESPSLDAALESLPSGVYVYRLQISNGAETVNKTGKFVVVK